MNCNFSIKHYDECLSMISKSSSSITMIHDIDIWSPHLNDILNLEILYKIESYWFFRFHAKNYNILSYESISFLKKFTELENIKCGIHIEPYYLSQFNILKEQITILEKILNKKIEYCSIHEPVRFANNCDLNIDLKIISYLNCKMEHKKYISDSSANWREGCMCNHINKHENLIILTHPNWWYKEYSGEIY